MAFWKARARETQSRALRFGSSNCRGFFQGSLDEVRLAVRWAPEIAAGPSPPPAPADVFHRRQRQVYLSWADVSRKLSSYLVGRSSAAGGPYSVLASVSSAAFTYRGLANGATYYYVVWAVNSAGQGLTPWR